jgi:NTP pyrophosphatase (non-canonical NTP hydrolase)
MDFKEINEWHKAAFPGCTVGEMMDKVKEEYFEFVFAVEHGTKAEAGDELADCLITLASMAGILGIDPESALASKFEKVKRKYPSI